MNIIAISMVKNEGDVIESFVRHNLKYVGRFIILDNGSTDGTLEILQELVKEGLPLSIIEDKESGYFQKEKTKMLSDKAFDLFNADIVIPLDADEFLRTPEENLTFLNKVDKNKVYLIKWVTYVPNKRDVGSSIVVPKLITNRRSEEKPQLHKLILTREIADKGYSLWQGNHDLTLNNGDKVIERVILENLTIAHFPLRSVNQANIKFVIGWLNYLCLPNINGRDGYTWFENYDKIVKNGTLDKQDIYDIALGYNAEDNFNVEVISDPISTINETEIKYYSHYKSDILTHIIKKAESLCGEISIFRKTMPKTDNLFIKKLSIISK
jgi:glycosyltransferase involved in cell wall biosynthesis